MNDPNFILMCIRSRQFPLTNVQLLKIDSEFKELKVKCPGNDWGDLEIAHGSLNTFYDHVEASN